MPVEQSNTSETEHHPCRGVREHFSIPPVSTFFLATVFVLLHLLLPIDLVIVFLFSHVQRGCFFMKFYVSFYARCVMRCHNQSFFKYSDKRMEVQWKMFVNVQVKMRFVFFLLLFSSSFLFVHNFYHKLHFSSFLFCYCCLLSDIDIRFFFSKALN